ncbi:nitroreductase family deazaflavin-dependent oxidoreductase [Nocardiopsis sp. RV163]|uniref:nitroreductase family deazaflavin-dependent oxidoreductase n=1 Tax=Nocardiopsis sp. RV163 TaxID=1661388 RepID=UPI00064BC0D7|nr:nitroreductase family deazaflavin-dependent oxidoreductase [Nocardiopsis sp. RV163]
MSFAQPPTTPLRRALFRAPIWIYRTGLGCLMGRRFVLLTHRGRATGEARQAVLEVIGGDDAEGTVLVASGYGRRSQWLRNVEREPRVLFQLGNRRHRGTAAVLSPQESGEALMSYAEQHPAAAVALLRALGYGVDDGEEWFERVGADIGNDIPVVRLSPAESAGEHHPGLSAP